MSQQRTGNSISQPAPQQQSSSSSSIQGARPSTIAKKLRNISLTMFCALVIVGVLFSGLFYVLFSLGIQNYHKLDPVKAYQFFQVPQYSQINSIVDNTQYLNLYGSEDTGILNYIQHEANLRAVEGKPVVRKQLKQENLLQNVHKSVKKAANSYLQMMMSPVGRGSHTWIILIKENQQAPLHEIQSIKKKYPYDMIILVSHKKLQVQSFKSAEFPSIKVQSLKQFMKKDLSLDEKDIKLIIKKKSTIPQAFQAYKSWALAKQVQAQQAEKVKLEKEKKEEQERIKKEKQLEEAKSKQQQKESKKGSKDKKEKKGKKQKEVEPVVKQQQKKVQQEVKEEKSNKKANKKQQKNAKQKKSTSKKEEKIQTVVQVKVQKKQSKKQKNKKQGKKQKASAKDKEDIEQQSKKVETTELENVEQPIQNENSQQNVGNSQQNTQIDTQVQNNTTSEQKVQSQANQNEEKKEKKESKDKKQNKQKKEKEDKKNEKKQTKTKKK